MADPNGWVQNPPNTFVKVVNTRQESMNGLYGIVLGFDVDRARYIVVLSEGIRQVSLKPENLTLCGWKERMMAQYQLFTNSPELQQQLREVMNRVQQKVPFLKTPEQLLGGIVVIFVGSIYLLGFSRTLLWITFMLMVGMLLGPIWTTNLGELRMRIPPRLRLLVRSSQIPFSEKIASNDYLLAALVLLILFTFVSGMIPRVKSTTAATSPTTSVSTAATSWMNRFLGSSSNDVFSSSSLPTPALSLLKEQRDHYYKLGFEDATHQRSFGQSLALEPEPHPQRKLATDENTIGLDYLDEFSTPLSSTVDASAIPPRRKSSSILSIGNLVTVAFLGSNLYQLGRNVDGQWDWELFRANLTMQPPWKLGLLGLTMYRVISALFL